MLPNGQEKNEEDDEEESGEPVLDHDEETFESAIDPADLVELGFDDEEGEEEGEEDEEEEEEEGEEGEPAAASATPKAKAKKSSKKGEEDEDELPEFPDTPVPTKKVMLNALEWAFSGEDNVPDGMLEKFANHALLLLTTNRELNITAILDPKEIAAKHYLDSWRLTKLLPLMAKTVLDLGSGGGFPGIPLAIAEPELSMVLCESRRKKAAYLESAVKKVGLTNVRAVHARAEEWLVDEKVNMVIIRDVSSVRENIRTLRKVRHSLRDLVMIKGNSWSRELRAAEREAERLGFRLDTVWEHDLPEDMGHRVVLVYRAPGGMGR
ncbi:MAG: 16S rRNA (guanine527-N7)-methyltransferase [Planctomycetota bacterium]|jgi:16S rRNA (guanine527-N7)-methyltransferase